MFWLCEKAVPHRTEETLRFPGYQVPDVTRGKVRKRQIVGPEYKPALVFPEVRDGSRVDTPFPWKLPYQR